ncbi:MAG: HAD family hydrolase [Magnetospirillum sp. WYHS-4]
MKPAVFLDRDGVLVRPVVRDGKPYAPLAADDMELLPGAAAAVARLKKAGFFLVVVTNQPDVARGDLDRAVVETMHARLLDWLPLDAVRTCWHDDRDGCSCRKPKPGLLLDAAADFAIDLAASYMVGDRWRDVEAGLAAGVRTVFIDYGWSEKRPPAPDFVVGSVAEAAAIVLGS